MPQYKRLVRRQPLIERIKNYLNPLDFLLWLSEELETNDWEQWQNDWAIPFGIAINLVMLIARANSASVDSDDVFSESSGGVLSWMATLVVHILSIASVANAFYTFYRRRHYRMFEAAVEAPLSTPSARRVKVDSSPATSTPLKYLSSVLSSSAESRAHPDPEKDVWEISIWDPAQFSLKMFCLFSPGHIMIYWLLLPSQDTRPSMTVVLTMAMISVLSSQMYHMQNQFSQQSKDTSLIQKEVLNEYNIKYVHPRTQPVMRDAAVQCVDMRKGIFSEVDTYTPVTVVSKGFQTNPNQNYLKHFNPEASPIRRTPRTSWAEDIPVLRGLADTPREISPTRRSMGHRDENLGISREQSPLKKAASQNLQRFKHINTPRRESGRF